MNTLGMTSYQHAAWTWANVLTGLCMAVIAARLAWASWHGRWVDPLPAAIVLGVGALQYLVRPWLLTHGLIWPLMVVTALTAGACVTVAVLDLRAWIREPWPWR